MQGYFRSRFLGDLRAAMPDLFIDADAPGCFWDDGGGYESDRELRTFIDDHYDLVADVPLVSGLKPVRIWRRREFATKNGIRP
jgi:hypothetical protein